MSKEVMHVPVYSFDSKSLEGVIIDALDRDGGMYDSHIMEEYFPDFDDSDCKTSLDLLVKLTEVGAKAVREGKLPLFRLLSRNYDIVLKELPFDKGLTLNDMELLIEAIKGTEGISIEIEAHAHECIAAGFVTVEAADELCVDSFNKGFRDYIAEILDDMNNESASCEYEYQGLKIWMSR